MYRVLNTLGLVLCRSFMRTRSAEQLSQHGLDAIQARVKAEARAPRLRHISARGQCFCNTYSSACGCGFLRLTAPEQLFNYLNAYACAFKPHIRSLSNEISHFDLCACSSKPGLGSLIFPIT